MKAKKKGKKRAKHYEPKLKIYASFQAAVKTLVSETKPKYENKR